MIQIICGIICLIAVVPNLKYAREGSTINILAILFLLLSASLCISLGVSSL